MYDSESDGITRDEYIKAIKNGDLDTVKAYVLSNGTIDLLLDKAIMYNQVQITEYLLQHDAPLDIFNGIKWADFIVKFIKKRVKVEALSIAYIYRCLRYFEQNESCWGIALRQMVDCVTSFGYTVSFEKHWFVSRFHGPSQDILWGGECVKIFDELLDYIEAGGIRRMKL